MAVSAGRVGLVFDVFGGGLGDQARERGELGQFSGAGSAGGEVGFEGAPVVGVEGAEGVGRGPLGELVVIVGGHVRTSRSWR